MSTIAIEERQIMIDLAKDFTLRMKNFNQELSDSGFDFILNPDNSPRFKNPYVHAHFIAFLNGRNTLLDVYNSLEKTLEIQRKEIEDLQNQLELQKEKSTTVNDASLLIAICNIYAKARQDYDERSDNLRKSGSYMKISFREYLADHFKDISDAVKIYKEKTNA